MLKFAIIGNPIHHSWSPFIHQQFASQMQIRLTYEALNLICENKAIFAKHLESLALEGYCGLNVTLPYKIWAFELIQEKKAQLSDRAKYARAVNSITFGTPWMGDNTDGIGLLRDLKTNLRWPIQGLNILLLGAGGAARGALSALISERPNCIHILNRDLSKAELLSQSFTPSLCEIRGFSEVDRKIPYHLMINATSASLWQALPSTISGLNAKGSYCYDMVYARLPTVFLDWATTQGARAISDGLGMLVEQAAESFSQWHHRMPKTSIVIQHLRQQL